MRWLGFLRRRQPDAHPAANGPHDDRSWKAGDMAECIADGSWFAMTGTGNLVPTTGPVKGEVRIVIGVSLSADPRVLHSPVMLGFARYEGRYHAASFRKLVPQADRAERGAEDFLSWARKFSSEQVR